MSPFYVVVSERQSDGLSNLTRYASYEEAHLAAAKKARQFTDTTFYIGQIDTAVLCPAPEVLTYRLTGAVREVA